MNHGTLFIITALALLTGCGPKWDVGAVAKTECEKHLAYLRDEERTELRDREAILKEARAERVGVVPAESLVELQKWGSSYSDEAYMNGCVAIAQPEIQTCANEFTFGTDSADQCVRRRLKDAKLSRAKRDAPRPGPMPTMPPSMMLK